MRSLIAGKVSTREAKGEDQFEDSGSRPGCSVPGIRVGSIRRDDIPRSCEREEGPFSSIVAGQAYRELIREIQAFYRVHSLLG